MNILNLSTYDIGGAAKATYRLHQNFIENGLNSEMLALTKRSNNNNVTPLREHNFRFKIQNILENSLIRIQTDKNYYFQNQSNSLVKQTEEVLSKLSYKPDVIIAHWVSNFIRVDHLYQLSKITKAPILWYLMDMAPLTGGCHYAWNCEGYMSQCGNCPALYSTKKDDLSFKNWKKKRDLIEKMNITLVPATSWLTKQSQKATVFNQKRIVQIMLSVDTDIFKPIPKNIARRKLQFPVEKKIIFFGTQSKEIKRKGLFYLKESLEILANQPNFDKENILIVTAGNISLIESFLKNTFQHNHLGFLNGDESLATAYQVADLFVCPSIEDSGPMMINEAIMCGTPVVSFEMGVALDLVHTGKTGYRAELKNSEDLAKGISYVLNLSCDQAQKMSEQCRKLGLELCSPLVQFESFNNLFNLLMNKK